MRGWPHWVQGLAVAVLLLLLGLVVILFTRSAPGTEVTVLATPTVVVVIAPTVTPTSTPSPRPATPTPAVTVVTATPRPEPPTPVVVVVTAPPAPEPPTPPVVVVTAPAAPAAPPPTPPGPSAEVRAYLDATRPRLQRADAALRAFSERSDRLASDPALLDDPAWRSEAATALAAVRAAGAELQAPGPVPEGAAPLDATLKPLGRDLVALADEYAAGLEARSLPRVNAALQRIQTIRPEIDRAAEQFNALTQAG
jgi:hypothetical protein